MPVPASDAIASDGGHGALGVRYALRPFRDLLSETVGQRHLWVELRPKKLIAAWTSDGGGLYHATATISELFDGVYLDVVGVQTLTETLTRKVPGETVAAGTYVYAADRTLYVHLTADANPANTSVVVELGVYVGSHGVYQPVLGPDLLANGTLEAWTGSAPDGWSDYASTEVGTITIDKTTTDPLQGTYAARVTFAAARGYKGIYQNFTVQAGNLYRVSGAYRNTCSTNGIHVKFYVWDGVGTYYLAADGRSIGGGQTVFDDAVGGGEWKRFAFDFVAPSWAIRILIAAQVNSGTETGTVDFDDLKFQYIPRVTYYEPLLSMDNLPTVEAARADSFWGPLSNSLGSLALLNGGGRFEPLLAAYDWLGAQCIVRVGGRFQLGGNEILMDDCPVIASGKLGPPTVSDSRVTFDLEDDRNILLRTLPPRTYNNNGGVDAYTQPDRGRYRPLLWGTKTGIRPVQYDIHYPLGGDPIPQGRYELVDTTDWPVGIVATSPTVYWYDSDESALVRRVTNRCEASGGSTITWVGNGGLEPSKFDVEADEHPIVLTQDNNKIAFETGGGVPLIASLTESLVSGTAYPLDYQTTSDDIAYNLTQAMKAVSGATDILVSMNASTQKMRISKTAGTLKLYCTNSLGGQNKLWDELGFDASSDKTGLLTYDAAYVRYYSADRQVIRCDATGFADDASGTYTGTANAAIEKAPDIARHILRVFLGQPASAVDVASFVAARAGWGAKPCSLYIGELRTVADVFEELETSGNMDLVLKGGIWYCYTRDTSVPAGTPDLVDSDFLSFEAGYDPEDLYGTVTLTYNEAPDGGSVVNPNKEWVGYKANSRTEMGETTSAAVALRHGRPNQKTFRTCLRDKADAAYPLAGSRLEAIATQAQTKRRRFRFATKGKALLVPVNGKIRLTRTKGLDATGALSQVLVRVLSKRDDWARWASDVEAIEVI